MRIKPQVFFPLLPLVKINPDYKLPISKTSSLASEATNLVIAMATAMVGVASGFIGVLTESLGVIRESFTSCNQFICNIDVLPNCTRISVCPSTQKSRRGFLRIY